MKVRKQDWIGIILFLLPALLLFLVFFILPVGFVAVMSAFEWNGINTPTFLASDNYTRIFGDPIFWRSLRNNLLIALVSVGIQVPLALLMGLILSKKPKGWSAFRTIYFLPQVISGIAIASLWSAVFNSEYGMLNGFLRLLGRDDLTTNWLGNPRTALACVLLYSVFYIGYHMVILMAGITNVDESYYEAAKIDGANRIQADLMITIPLIKSSLMTSITLAAVFGLRTFEQINMLTNGGPANRTSVLMIYLYNQMDKNSYGTANAASVMLILTGAFVIMTIRTIFAMTERDKKAAGGRK